MMRDPQRTGIDRVVAQRDNAKLLRSDCQVEVLQVNTGIVAIPLFKIDDPSSGKCVGFGSEFSGTEMDDDFESRKVFGPSCL